MVSECLASGEAFLLGYDMAEGTMRQGSKISLDPSSSLESLPYQHGLLLTFIISSPHDSQITHLQILSTYVFER